jgi:tight adherence protein B
MWLPVAVFVGVVALIVGAYWFFIVQEETKLITRLAPKVKSKAGTVASARGFLKTEQRMSSVDPIDKMLGRVSGISVPIKDLIDQAGMKLSVGTFMLASLCSALAVYFLTVRFTHNSLFGLMAAVPAMFLPLMYVRRARTKRLYKFEEQFPEAIDLIARALRAGHALPTGLSMVADELPMPVGGEFRTLYDEQNFGLTLPDALRNFAHRVEVLDARFFVTAVMTQREAGGNLAEVLDNLSAVIRERFKIKRQVRVISAHGRITGWILAGLPPSVAVASFALNPHHLEVLLGDQIGIRMIETAVVMQVVGTLIIRKIVDVEY